MLSSTTMLPSLITSASFMSSFDPISTTPIPLTTLFPQDAIFSSLAPNFSSSTMAPVTNIPTVHPYIVYARRIYIWLVPVMVSVLTIAVIGNGLIVISAPWLRRPINPYHRLCVSLAAADTWAASLLVTGLIVNSYLPVVIGIHKQSECLAAFLEIFRISGMLTSNLHIFALAVHQFVGIVYPLRYKMILTTRRQRLLIFILWTVPLAFILAWFVAIPNDGFRHPTCKLTFYGRLPFRLSVFISFIVPLFATFALYANILFTLIKAKAKCNADLRRSMHDNYRRRVKSKLKLVWTTLLILSTFTMSWGLCVLYFVLVCIDGCIFVYRYSVSFQVGFLLNSTVNFLVMVKLLLNPLIYALRMKHIRKSVLACLRITCFCCFKHLKANSMTNLTTNNGMYSSVNDKVEKGESLTQHKCVHRTTSDKVCKQRRTSMCPKPMPKSALRSSSTAFETRPRNSQDEIATLRSVIEPEDSIQLLENVSLAHSKNQNGSHHEFWHDTDSEA